MTPPTIFVSMPVHYAVEPSTARGLIELSHALVDAGIGFQLDMPVGESLITRARNKLAKRFLASKCTHQLWIDSDIAFTPNDVRLLVASKKSLIGGIYPKKCINWPSVAEAARRGVPDDELDGYAADYVVHIKGEHHEAVDGVLPVEYLGTGFLLVGREVYEAIAEREPDEWYVSDMLDDMGDRVWNFFEAPRVDRTLLSEDYDFCRRAKLAGFQPYAHVDVKLGHTGSYCFRGDLMNFLVPTEAT